MLKFDIDDGVLEQIEEVSIRDIAIIGIDINLPKADSLDGFWRNLKKSRDCVGVMPAGRQKDIRAYLRYKGEDNQKTRFAKGGYLEEIDKFDYEFFKIPYHEAKLMDPNQRIFLQSAWKALEDSGYGGNKLAGSNTGVYVGFTPGREYYQYIKEVDKRMLPYAETGNLSSVVASRISYILNLKGPSMIINTECSSSLVALHLACRSLRSNEIDIAIAGGVRIAFCPVYTDELLGLESEEERIRTFDDDSDGAIFGEGSIAIVIKRYDKAVKDRDSIYAVIKGSCINQDGSSVGITAPNVSAQEEVIRGAWGDAGILPDDISYIEAHGTGTKLGDPVEIQGINRAFGHYTDKKQFCGIGSVKTNLSHLDNVSGLASLVKSVLALKNRQIPPSIHFRLPNRNIEFETSAVYVNSRLSPWETDCLPRKCGVSSFGLSGTNSHVVLEESPQEPEDHSRTLSRLPRIFTVSAVKKEGLLRLADHIKEYISDFPETDIDDVCYTMNTGRGHYRHRLAVIAHSLEELKLALAAVCLDSTPDHLPESALYGTHTVLSRKREDQKPDEITSSEKQAYDRLARELIERYSGTDELYELARLYVKGADIDWDIMYRQETFKRIHLPTYVFEKKRCWLEIQENRHPLIDSADMDETAEWYCFHTEFSVGRHWVLSEHKIFDRYIVPGTCFLEMAREGLQRIQQKANLSLTNGAFELKNIAFLTSLSTSDPDAGVKVQTVMKKKGDAYAFVIGSGYSRESITCETWKMIYCEGEIRAGAVGSAASFAEIRARCLDKIGIEGYGPPKEQIVLGNRWTKLVQEVYGNNQEYLLKLELPEEYQSDLDEYYIHPSVYDMAINTVTQNMKEEIYLPFHYGSLKVFLRTEHVLYSFIYNVAVKDEENLLSCDLVLFSKEGKTIARIEDFTAKRISSPAVTGVKDCYSYKICYIEQKIIEQEIIEPKAQIKDDNIVRQVLIFDPQNRKAARICEGIKAKGHDTEAMPYVADYDEIAALCANGNISIVHLLSLSNGEVETPEYSLKRGIYSLLNIAKAAAQVTMLQGLELVVVSDFMKHVTEDDPVNPYHACINGLVKVIANEIPGLYCRVIDIDGLNTAHAPGHIVETICSKSQIPYIAYRNGRFYRERMEPAELPAAADFSDMIRKDGAYVITGGMGGLGIRIAECIGAAGAANIALIGRRDFGASKERDLFYKIRDTGAGIFYYQADVADPVAVGQVFHELRSRFGRINGIVHAAGISDDALLKNVTKEQFAKVLKPKVHGTQILADITQDDEMDFVVNFSSISSLYGYLGQGAYAAANSFLDAARALQNNKTKRYLSINWAPWSGAGMAHESGQKDVNIFKMLPVAAGVEFFQRALLSKHSNLIIGKVDYEKLKPIYEKTGYQFDKEMLKHLQSKAAKAPRTLTGSGPRIEKNLLAIWNRILGIEDIDVYESFLNLGGDSIQAIALMKAVDQKYPGKVRASDIFSYPSIKEMAQYISSQSIDQDSDRLKEITDILSDLESGKIQVSEARLLLDKNNR